MSRSVRTSALGRRQIEVRPQIALELLLNAYALVGGLIVLRSLLLAIGVNRRLWIGHAIYGATRYFALPLTVLPGGDLVLLGELTVADATLLAGVVLFPILLFLLRGRFARYRT